MTKKPVFAFLLGLTALGAFVAALHIRNQPVSPAPPQPETNVSSTPSPSESTPELAAPELLLSPGSASLQPGTNTPGSPPPEDSAIVTNKLQRLTGIRETFRALATGDPATAMRAAKPLADETERETALLTLVTEWTRGDLNPASQRARYVAVFGLEAGLGMELVKNPELAILWANELTDGLGRSALLQQTAVALAGSDPIAALALSGQVTESEREKFREAVYGGWAANDTAAALQWVDQLADPDERDAALQAVRAVAPVGIGAELRMQDGYPVINQLLSGTPAQLSGQLHPGDRIVALAQGDNSFVDARRLSLAEVVQLVRGAPGTPLQLQILPADAPPDSAPRTVSIIRDQIKFKK